jgi:hypothetical protein
LLGIVAWSLANPLLDWEVLDPPRMAANLLLAAGAGSFLPLAYTWFVANRPDPLMAARGLAAALVAVSSGVAFLPPWAALAIGGTVGLLTPLVCYLVDHILRWDDPTATVTVHGLGALLGLLAVGVFSDGTLGAGWNSVGAGEYLHVPGQGVSGLLTSAGFQPDWPGQLQSQAVGVAALALFPFVVAGLAFGPLAGLTHLLRKRSDSVSISGGPEPDEHAQAGGQAETADPADGPDLPPAGFRSISEWDEHERADPDGFSRALGEQLGLTPPAVPVDALGEEAEEPAEPDEEGWPAALERPSSDLERPDEPA